MALRDIFSHTTARDYTRADRDDGPRARVTLDAGSDRHPVGCECRTCQRREALREPGRVPRVDGFDHSQPRHPHSGRFIATGVRR